MSKIKGNLILTPEVHHNLFFSNLNFDHLKQLFASISKIRSNKDMVWYGIPYFGTNLYGTPLFQTLSKALGMSKNTPLTSARELLSKMAYELSITVELYMNLLVENQIAKV